MPVRFWLTNGTAGYTPTSKRGAWDVSSSTVVQSLDRLPDGVAATSGVADTSATNNWDVLLGRWVSPPVATAGTISGTVSGVLGALESNVAMNAFLHVHMYVTTGNTDTPRGTILTDYIGTTEFPNPTATGLAFGPASLTSLAVSVGDRIVVEIGYQAQNTVTTSYTGTVNYGNTGTTDLANLSTAVTTNPGWLEISGNAGMFNTPFGNLADTFDTGIAATWTAYNGAGFNAGRVRIPCDTTYPGMQTASKIYELRDSQIFCSMPTVPANTANSGDYCGMFVQPNNTPGTGFCWIYHPSTQTITAENQVSYADGAAFSAAYNATNYKFLRIRESSGTVYWDSSPDGSTWTNRKSVTTPSWANTGYQYVMWEGYQSTGSGYFEIDNVNTPGSVAYTQSPADSVGVTDQLAISFSDTAADTVGVTDSIALSFSDTQADNVGVTDTTTVSQGWGQNPADTVGVTDSVTVLKGFDQQYADTVGVTDAIVSDVGKSVSDSENVTDSISTVYTGSRTFADDTGVTDSTVVSKGWGQNPADSVGVTDAASLVQGWGRVPADTVGVTDTAAIKYDGIRTLADNENLTDTVALSASNVKADSVGITDAVTIDKTTIPVVPPSTRPMVGLTIKLFDPAPAAAAFPGLMGAGPMGVGGAVTSVIPDIKAISWTDELSQAGTVQIEYPTDGVNYALLTADRAEGAVFWGSMEIPGTRFLVSEQARDPLDEQGGVVKINAPAFVNKRLSEAIVHPPNWPTSSTPMQQTFSAATPGGIMQTLILQAQARGALGNLEWDFTSSVDSNGNAWSQVVDLELNVGDAYDAVLKKLTEMTVVDWRGNGRKLQMYNWGTLGSDKSAGASPVVLFAGRDLEDSPENRSVLDLKNAILSVGDEGNAQSVSDSTSIATFGRIEGFVSTQGVKAWPTLGLIGGAVLQKSKHVQEEFTHNLTWADDSSPVPYVDYGVGDKILRVVNGVAGAYVIRQMTFSQDSNGDLKATLTLNDKFYTQDVMMDRRINALTGGSSSSSSAPADPGTDKVPPNAPTGLLVTSAAYVGNGGITYAALSATWTEPTTNTDGSTFTDLDHYEVQWQYTTDSNWTSAGSTGGNVLQWTGLLPGRNINVRVQAVDQNNNRSAWSSTTAHTTASDSTAPPQPSTPVVSNYLGVLRVSWDGLTNGGGSQPSDFAGAEVHVSTVNNFTPTSATKVDTLPAAGVSVISALPGGTALVYGTTYYVKLISVDRTGNASTPSAQGSGAPQQVVQTDIGTGQVGLSNLSFSDVGNLIDDGSFELSNWRTARTGGLPSGWAFAQDQVNNGLWSLKITNTVAGTVNWTIRSGINVNFGEVYVGVFDYRMTGTTAGGTVTLVAVFKNGSGTTLSEATLTTANTIDSTWHGRTAGSDANVPSGASYMDIVVRVTNITAGSVWIDSVEVRQRMDTLLIANAAITNAKIADLAVNNAKISDLAVGKVTAGTIVADWVLGARIKTADTGARVELNSTGLKAYNSGGTNTVSFLGADGSAFMLGQVVSGTTGRRLELNPTATYLPEIRFYPTTGSNYGFLNAVASGSDVQVGLNTGTFTSGSNTAEYRLYMTPDVGGSHLQMVRISDQSQYGGSMHIYPHAAYVESRENPGDDKQGFLECFSGTLGSSSLGARVGHNGILDADDAWTQYLMNGDIETIGTWNRSIGYANGAVQNDTWSLTSSTSGGTWSWAVTMNSTIYPSITFRDSPAIACTISALSTASFSFTLSANSSGASAINWWGWR